MAVQYLRHRDGAAVTAAEADALIEQILKGHRYEAAIREQAKQWDDPLKGDKKLEKRLMRALVGMVGLYAFPFSGAPEYEFTVRLPGELVETNGTGNKGGRTRWKFDTGDLFPDGFEMKARSIVIDRDGQKKVLGRMVIDDETRAIEFMELAGGEGTLLEAVRKVRQTGDRNALSQVKTSSSRKVCESGSSTTSCSSHRGPLGVILTPDPSRPHREPGQSYAATPVISELLTRCFDSDILPSRASHPRRFAQGEIYANLYTSEREWHDPVNFDPDGVDRHENYLDHLFWERSPPTRWSASSARSVRANRRWSTTTCGATAPIMGGDREEFDKKLIIQFDSRDIQDNTDFYHLFFLYTQSSIRVQCAQRSYDIDAAIKRRPTQPNNVREWVWAALEEMSRVAARGSRHCPIPVHRPGRRQPGPDAATVQIRAITEVEQWLLNPQIRIWRVFLPLWPSTFSYLRNHRFNMLRGVHIFRLGALDTEHADRQSRAGLRHAAPGVELVDGPPGVDYLSEITQFAKKRLLDRILGLSHGSLRLMLSLWGGFLRSEAAYSIWRQRRANTESSRGYEYELLDALIVGSPNRSTTRTHRIANLFTMGHAHARPRDLLIGPHALFLMAQGFHRQRTLTDALVRLGYSSDNVQDAIDACGTFNILHQVPAQGGVVEYEIHDSVIQEYVGEEHAGRERPGLIWEPAYVDNVAKVTPVEPALLPKMRKTRGDWADDFTDRVETTLLFLGFLRSCEDSFRDPKLLRPGVDPVSFRESLEKTRIPCLWRGMAAAYRNRLSALRQGGYLKNVDPRWWVETLGAPLFLDVDQAEVNLTPR